MRIRNNILSLNAYRHFDITGNHGLKSLEKLSSGNRINRAGDDSAGLSISQKMRSQIRGLNMAARNTQQAISLLRTADGALNETHSILQRMRELAVQATNDGLSNDERMLVQTEIDKLAEGVTSIADNTEYNGKKLLDGNFNEKFQIGANNGETHELSLAKMDAIGLNLLGGYKGGTVSDVSGAASDVQVNMGTYIYGDLSNVTINTAGLRINTATYLVPDITNANNINNDGIELSGTLGNAITKGAGISVSVHENPATSAHFSIPTDEGWAMSSEGEHLIISIDNSDPIEIIIPNTYIANIHNIINEQLNTALSTTGKQYAKFSLLENTITISSLTTGEDSKLEILDNYLGTGSGGNFPIGVDYGTDTTYDVTFSDGEQTYEYNVPEGTDNLQGQGEFAGLNINLNSPITGSTGGTIEIQEGINYIYSGSIMVGDTAVNINAAGIGTVASGKYMGLQVDVTGLTAEAAHEGTFSITGRIVDEEAGLIVTDPQMAISAMQKIDEAISLVSSERVKIGSLENRLESTLNNLEKYTESLTLAESRICDTDMTSELMQQTKDKILHNSAQAMLAQAINVPELVLSLLA